MDASFEISLTYCFIKYLPNGEYVGNLTRLNLALNHEEHEAHQEKHNFVSFVFFVVN